MMYSIANDAHDNTKYANNKFPSNGSSVSFFSSRVFVVEVVVAALALFLDLIFREVSC